MTPRFKEITMELSKEIEFYFFLKLNSKVGDNESLSEIINLTISVYLTTLHNCLCMVTANDDEANFMIQEFMKEIFTTISKHSRIENEPLRNSETVN
jgi:hypothetical protein